METNIYNIKIGFFGGKQGREHVIEYVKKEKKKNPNYRVIDIGGSVNSWSSEITDCLVDLNDPVGDEYGDILHFKTNINAESGWVDILRYVQKHGKFDFCICSHVLEDIAYPQVSVEMFNKIAKGGFIAVPTKYRELSVVEMGNRAPWLGYFHHRWIYSLKNNKFVGYPKLNFIQAMRLTAIGNNADPLMEFNFFWKDKIEVSMYNGDFLGPSFNEVIAGYAKDMVSDDLDDILYGK